MLRHLLESVSDLRIAIFKPYGKLKCYNLSFCEDNLSLLHLQRYKKLEFYEATSIKRVELYNIYEIYLSDGIVPGIKIQDSILLSMNKRGVAELTDNFLSQD